MYEVKHLTITQDPVSVDTRLLLLLLLLLLI